MSRKEELQRGYYRQPQQPVGKLLLHYRFGDDLEIENVSNFHTERIDDADFLKIIVGPLYATEDLLYVRVSDLRSWEHLTLKHEGYLK